jgi:hypothetical protein
MERQKDWSGNTKSIYVTLGASNHVEEEREENDYYATHPKAVEMLLDLEEFDNNILEPCCGEGHISKVLEAHGYNVRSMDLIDRGYGECGIDFLKFDEEVDADIITNPPYKYAQEFVEHAMDIVTNRHKVCMFLKLTFLESSGRKELFKKYPPKKIWVSSSRIPCGKNGDFYDRDKNGNIKYDKNGNPKEVSSAVCYAFFVWEKGYSSDTTVGWFN